MECKHKEVFITPTMDTARGIEARLYLVCEDCREEVLCLQEPKEIREVCEKNKYKIEVGLKYIGQLK